MHDYENSRMVADFDDGIENYFPPQGFNLPRNISIFPAFGVEGFGQTGFLFRLLICALIIALIYYIINNKPF